MPVFGARRVLVDTSSAQRIERTLIDASIIVDYFEIVIDSKKPSKDRGITAKERKVWQWVTTADGSVDAFLEFDWWVAFAAVLNILKREKVVRVVRDARVCISYTKES